MKKHLFLNEKGSITTVLVIIALLVLVFVGVFIFRPFEKKDDSKETTRERKEKIETEEELNKRLISVLDGFVGLPHLKDPLNEDILYTEEGFNSTTLILSVVAKTYKEDAPEEVIKAINYYPPGVVKFENRNHFSTYRNKVSPYFNDITTDVGKEYAKTKNIILNKEKDDGKRIININWEKEIEIKYIPTEYVSYVLNNLPSIAGVMFTQEKDEEIGLDVRGEGIVIENKDFVYASSEEGRVIKIDFIEYLENSYFDGVIFYEFVEL